MDKPKVAVIGLKGLPAFGGAATVGENIVEQLKNQYDFTVYAVSSHTDKFGDMGGYYQRTFKKFPIKKFNIFLYYLKSAFHCLFRSKYQLIHLHHVDGAFILPLLRLKYKVVGTSHARPQEAEKWPWYVKTFFAINEQIFLRLCSEVTSVALPLQRVYSKLVNRKIHYIPNGIDIQLQPSDQELPYRNHLLFAAGRIIPLKGLHLLLEAMHNTNCKDKLLVLGDLSQMPQYKEKILQLAEGLDVEFLGLVKDKRLLLRYIKNCKLFIFPSYNETMSIMLLEVASMRSPLLASNIPENEAIFDANEVLYFKSNSVNDLQEKLSHALNNPEHMKELTEKAYNKLKNHFVWDKIAQEYSSLYKRLML